MDEDLGSREVIRDAEKLVWYPAEVDTSIRTGWFYHPEEDTAVRSAEELLDIYCSSVGGNASLLLNIPPDTHGKIAAPDCAVLGEHLPTGQRIEAGEIRADGKQIIRFTTVGHKRICRFSPVQAKELEVRITSSRAEPTLRMLEVYRTGKR